MKKGFTMVELLGVIVVLAILLLIAIPVYSNINSKIKENIYQSKLKEILAKSELYAEETGRMIFGVQTLIDEGKIEADNELGEFNDPRNDRDMACDIVMVNFISGNYVASLRESAKCFSDEELENLYGMVKIKVVNEKKEELKKPLGTNWYNAKTLYLAYDFIDSYDHLKENIEEISWIIKFT